MNAACGVSSCIAPFADCDGTAANGCETDTRTDAQHCGGCNMACAPRPGESARCEAGRCERACTEGFADCDSDPTNGCETNLRTEAQNCGGCGRRCDLANASATCTMGQCTVAMCAAGFGDCDTNAANGCETDTNTTVTHCGGCATACPARPNALPGCVSGGCVFACVSGFADCDSDPTNGCETDTRTNAQHCGTCARSCAVTGGTGTCTAGTCSIASCVTGRADCDNDPANGCETDTSATVAHCGSCGQSCSVRPNSSPVCTAGVCVNTCAAGYENCDADSVNGCETDTRTSEQSCGACGRVCSPANAVGECVASVCTISRCDATRGDCNHAVGDGCETDLQTNTGHCGACGNACIAGGRCISGVCTTPVLSGCAALHAAAPTLPSGVYEIDPDASGPIAPFRVYCDMVTDGGGWTYGAIVRTTTPSDNRTRVAGVTAFGTPVANKLDNEYSVNLTGVNFHEIRIDNFTLGRNVQRSLAAPVTWTNETYTSLGGLRAKRIALASSHDFRVGYYTANYCGLDRTNIPMCFTLSSNPVGWVCDTDSGEVEGWVDVTGGEICGMYYCRMLWRDTACHSYVSTVAVYGFAVR